MRHDIYVYITNDINDISYIQNNISKTSHSNICSIVMI